MDFGIASVAGITMICYLAGMGMKASETRLWELAL